MDDDHEDDQLHLGEPEKRGADDGSEVHQHHDAVIVDQERNHVAKENFVMADVLESLTEMLERNRKQGFAIRDWDHRAGFTHTEVHRQG